MKKSEATSLETDDNIKKNISSQKTKNNTKKKQTITTSSKKQLSELQNQIKQLFDENSELNDKCLRLAADFDNYKKMTVRDTENRIQSVKESTILDVLTVMDNLDRTIKVIKGKKKNDPIAKGILLIRSQTMKLLEKYSVEEIKSVGEVFDVELHEAMIMVENQNYPANVVVEELLKGYRINGRTLRHAQVAVNKELTKYN